MRQAKDTHTHTRIPSTTQCAKRSNAGMLDVSNNMHELIV